ncbi:MAG: Rrf2 family transcriptional regulator [Dehalococcoidia bacterium]
MGVIYTPNSHNEWTGGGGQVSGIRLARPPESIRLGDVVRDFEEDMALVECFSKTSNTCPIEPDCQLKGVLRESLRAFLGKLDDHTLADLVRPRRKLRGLLDVTP